MSALVCVICGSVWYRSIASDNGKDSNGTDGLGNEENLNVLDAFCTQLEVNLGSSDQRSLAENPLPFCFTCKGKVNHIFQLQEQIFEMQIELNKTVESIKQQIDNSGENFERTLESVAVTEWVKNLRAALDNAESTKELKKRSAKSRIMGQDGFEVKEEILTCDSGSGDGDSKYSDWTPSVEEKEHNVKTSNSRRKNVETNIMEISVTDQSSSSSENDSEDDYDPKSKRSKKMKQNRRSRAFEKKNRSVNTRSGGTYEHVEKPDHCCRICGKDCEFPSRRLIHESTHSDNQDHLCVECGKGFKNNKNLKRHLKETHKISMKFRCTTCLEQLRNAEELRKHMGTTHSDDQSNRIRELSNVKKSRLCDNCGRIFKTIEARQTHEESHAGEKFFKCFYCKALYLRKQNIKIHFEKDHGIRV